MGTPKYDDQIKASDHPLRSAPHRNPFNRNLSHRKLSGRGERKGGGKQRGEESETINDQRGIKKKKALKSASEKVYLLNPYLSTQKNAIYPIGSLAKREEEGEREDNQKREEKRDNI